MTSVSLPKPHSEGEERGVSLDEYVCVVGQQEREGDGGPKESPSVGVLVFISLTKFTDRGAEVEARRCSRVTGHKVAAQIGGREKSKIKKLTIA